MSATTFLAVAFLAVAVGSLAVHVSTLSLIVRTGPGKRMAGAYQRLTGTLRIRAFGAALYSVIGLVALVATPITALAALVVFTILTAAYTVNSIRDGRYWRTERALEDTEERHGPGVPRRAAGAPHSRTDCAGAHRPRGSPPTPVPRERISVLVDESRQL